MFVKKYPHRYLIFFLIVTAICNSSIAANFVHNLSEEETVYYYHLIELNKGKQILVFL